MFCVHKSSTHDRLILNPTTINSRMLKHSNFTCYLAPGSLLCLAHLEAHEVLRMCADDLSLLELDETPSVWFFSLRRFRSSVVS